MITHWLDKHRTLLFIATLLITLAAAGLFVWQQPPQSETNLVIIEATESPTVTPSPSPTATATPSPVRIYITGAIATPDVYFLPSGSIIKDAIQAAGGLTAEVDLEAFNQALELRDQQHIHIPRMGETDGPPLVQGGRQPEPTTAATTTANQPATATLININTASVDELDTLPRIGPALGQRIVDYRTNYGAFSQVEEIMQVSGIGEATFAQIKSLITVE